MVPQALEYRSVTYRYGTSRKPVVSQFSWRPPTDGRTALLGPNGAGKTTLLKMAAGILNPQSGTVERPSSVGYLPQHPRAVRGLTTIEQVAYASWLSGLSLKEARRRAYEALSQVDLTDQSGSSARILSGGQRQRMGIAAALATGATTLVLDEPGTGLDPHQRAGVRELLVSLQLPTIASTHLVDDLERVFAWVAVMHQGQLCFDGSVGEFLDAYGGPRREAETAYTAVLESLKIDSA